MIREPLRMWKDEKIQKSDEVRDDEGNVLTERTERQSTTRENVVLAERTAEILQVLTEGNVEATPFRKKNFSAQGDYEVVSLDGAKGDVEFVAACEEGSKMAVEGMNEPLERIVK